MAVGLYRARQKAGSKSSGNPKDRFEDLDKALVMALENTLSYLKGGNMEIDSMTQKTYDFIKRRKRMTQAAKMTQLAIAALEDKKPRILP